MANDILAMPAPNRIALNPSIGHLPACSNFPWLNRVVVVERHFAACFNQLRKRWLDIARLINGATHDDVLFTIPVKQESKCRERLVHNRRLQGGRLPGVAAIGRYVYG